MITIAKHTPPALNDKSFNCVHCGVFATQSWQAEHFPHGHMGALFTGVSICKCTHCLQFTVWHTSKMIYPSSGSAPMASLDLPADIRIDYEEARSICDISPRGAAALLRLAIQKLCKHLGEKGDNIHDDIKKLVSNGLPAMIQQALDTVRVVGNSAVHPGLIDNSDISTTAYSLFGLVNLICDVMITQPAHVEQIYNSVVPASTRESIAKRDGKPPAA